MPKPSRFAFAFASFPVLRAGALTFLVLVGCGGDKERPGGGMRRDTGVDPVDSGSDASEVVDAGVDAYIPDGFELTGPCRAPDGGVLSFEPSELEPQPMPNLVAAGNTFGLVSAELSDCVHAIQVRTMPSNQKMPTGGGALDECTPLGNAVGVSFNTEWVLAWLDQRPAVDGTQVYSARFDPAAAPPLTPPARTPLTANASTKGSLAMLRLSSGDAALLAWTETDGAQSSIHVRHLQASDGAPTGDDIVVADAADTLYTALSMTALEAGGAVLGYVAGSGATRSIFLQELADDGSAVGEPSMLSTGGDAQSSVTIAMKGTRGAAVYSVNLAGTRELVRFQELDADGKPVGQYRQVSGTLEHANGIGIVPTINGYAIAYRATSDYNWDFARIRMGYLTNQGGLTGDGISDLAVAADRGGAPALAVALDGRVAVSWFDQDELNERTLKLLSYPCNP